MEYPDWLNGLITALSTAILAGITFYYAKVTKRILKESEQMRIDAQDENHQMRIDAQRPEISIYLDSYMDNRIGLTQVDLYVENIGPGPAYEVKFITDPSPITVGNNMSLQEAPFIRMGIGYLAPGKQRKHRVGASSQLEVDDYKENPPKITATYKDGMGNEQEPKEFPLNFFEHIGR